MKCIEVEYVNKLTKIILASVLLNNYIIGATSYLYAPKNSFESSISTVEDQEFSFEFFYLSINIVKFKKLC